MDGVKISMNPHYVFSPSNKQCRVDKSNRGGLGGPCCQHSVPTLIPPPPSHMCVHNYSKACKCVGDWLVSRAACGGISSHTHTHIHSHTHKHTHSHTHKHTHSHTHTCSHKHTLTHMHTHTHTNAHVQS